jgi:CRP/FNR family transcriptional regulator, cyclic AMP receptor protein
MSADIASILGQTELFSSAPAREIEAIVTASRLRTLRRGQVVFTTGDPGDSLLVVLSGLVKVVVRSVDGAELTLVIVRTGGVLGELSVTDGGARSADAETLEECRLLFIPRGVILDICSRVPAVSLALARSLAATLRRLTEETSDLVFLDLPRRVAKVLLAQPRDNDGIIRHRMNQEQLAHQVGGSRPSVNVALRGFQRRGWIEMQDRSIAVKKVAALERFVGS